MGDAPAHPSTLTFGRNSAATANPCDFAQGHAILQIKMMASASLCRNGSANARL